MMDDYYAVIFAKEIKRKKQAIKNTESPNLKKQYQIDELIPYEHNAKEHNETQIK